MDAAILFHVISCFIAKGFAYIAESSSTYEDYVASRAVDGDTDQNVSRCSHTDVRWDITEAWLRIDFGRVYSVKSVKIWYRADRGSTDKNTIRLRGYSLRVSNDTTVPTPESSCYTDPGNVTLPTVVEEDCEKTARYIWIYQSNKPNYENCPMLEVCEVKIFGCNVGHYGDHCLRECDHCKNNTSCGIKDKECDEQGCKNTRYKTPLCQQCKMGTYGSNCLNKCNKYCMNNDCHTINGTCTQGCKRGYIGNLCNDTCEKKTYGQNCSETCGNCLNDEVCHHVNGTCPDGCAAGYRTHNCKTTCNDGKYGVNCLSSCSGHCINGEACNKKDGSCRACEAGYEGRKCKKTCRAGIYGQNCSFPCGACLHSTPCNHINGSCKIGCEPGWQTETCRTACSDGRYGENCQYTCSGHCVNGEACDKTNGSCRSCVYGYQGSKCDRDISQSPTSFKKRISPEDLKMMKMMLENERIQKEILKLEAETEVLRARKNVLLRLQGILSELSEVVVQLLNETKI